MTKKKHSFLYRNSLSIVSLLLMMVFLFGQFYTGWKEHNKERIEMGNVEVSAREYFVSGHFMQATFENWESEFLQMCLYVLLTISLRQKGSSESKKLDGKEEVDRKPKVHPDAPWPVKKGGIWLKLYENSLSLAFLILFILSFIFHFIGSLKNQNEEEAFRNIHLTLPSEFIADSRFWFESFQNWQSEFLSVASIVLLSIWLRQKGSPESKPVDASYASTGG